MYNIFSNNLLTKFIALLVFAPVLIRCNNNNSKNDIPDLSLKLFHGKYINFKDTCKSKVTVINIWSTFCSPCLEELPDINQLYEDVKANKNITFLTIAMNTEEELNQFIYSKDSSNPYRRTFLLSKIERLTMPVLIGSKSGYTVKKDKDGKSIAFASNLKEDEKVYNSFKFLGIPTTLIYNNGHLVHFIKGIDSHLRDKIDSLLSI